jgi:hypothetical protein
MPDWHGSFSLAPWTGLTPSKTEVHGCGERHRNQEASFLLKGMTMECQECELIIHDFLRTEATDEEARTEAFEHIFHCAHCEARFSNVRSLESALRTLAQTAEAERSAAQLEPILRAVFRQRKKVGQRSWSVASWAAMGVAASLLLSIGLVLRQEIFAPERKPQVSATPQPIKPPETTVAQIPEPAATLPQEPRKHRKPKRRVLEQGTFSGEFVTGFYALPYAQGSDRLSSGEIIRVKLRGSALPAIGFPVALNSDRATDSITADLFVGENGVPLAIRFVR